MRKFCLALAVVLSGCALPQFGPELELSPVPVDHSTPITWRKTTDTHDFIALALSGGGTKAAVFSGEAMFTLEALGLLQQASLISTVSGGSFAGALYALSCDDEARCAEIVPGRKRPVWQHDAIMKVLGQGYQELVNQQIARVLIPFVSTTISADDFALYIDRNYLGGVPGSVKPASEI
jgi:predicted acylesterase/phospholipase RssA